MWMSFFSLVDISSYIFGNNYNAIEPTHAPPTPNACPHEVEIIGEDDTSMHEFIIYFLNNSKTNASFYPFMREPTQIEMF